MKHFYLHDAVGKIVSSGTCQDEDFALQARTTLTLREGEALYGVDYFDGTVARPIPTRSDSHHQFNYTTKQWEDPRTLQDRKDAQWEQIKQAREAAIDSPLITPYGVFDTYPDASANIIKSVLLANNLVSLGYPVAIDFTLADNAVVTLDAAGMVQVGLVMAAREQTIRAKASLLRAQIDAAQSLEVIDAVVWTIEPIG